MRAAFGKLMNLCPSCDGHGYLDPSETDRPFIAIWPVSQRYVVHMRVPKRKGGFVELDVAWSPKLPPKRGRGKLTYQERAAYEAGRNEALAVHMSQMGGGDFSVVTADQRQ
jgi:hypothetical protein